jgi:hypothetical protein
MTYNDVLMGLSEPWIGKTKQQTIHVRERKLILSKDRDSADDLDGWIYRFKT